MQLQSNLWFTNKTKGYFGKGRIELLEQIDQRGSISKAAKAMKMSYKSAWDAVNEMNNLSDSPIVKRETGGKGGGGTVLTAKGHEYIEIYKQVEKVQHTLLESLQNFADDPQKLIDFSSKLTLRTSARNQLQGTVKSIKASQTKVEVTISLYSDIDIVVIITNRSLKDLDIHEGSKLYVLLKSSWISLHKELPCALEYKNSLQGLLSNIQEDGENSEVTIDLSEQNTLIASLSTQMLHSLNLKENDTVWAVFDTSSALLAV